MKSTATANPVMTGHAQQFMRDPAGFVGMALLPPFFSAEQSSTYYVWNRENGLLIPGNIRHAPGAPFSRSIPSIADDNYACRDFGHETPVPDEIRSKYRNQIDADVSSVRRNVDIMKVNHEKRVKTLVTSSAVPNAAISVKWNDNASNPKGDVDVAKEEIRKNCGQRANLMVISEQVRFALSDHPKIADRVKYTSGGLTSLQQLAAYFEVGRIVVAEQVEASNQEGQTLTPADIWGDDVILAHVRTEQDLMLPGFGRTFVWTEFAGGSGEEGVPVLIESYRDETCASDIHRSRHFTDEKVTFDKAAYRLSDALA